MTTEIKVCMGSACFAKGNQDNLEYIKEYIEENNLDSEISIIGALCENKCEIGPRIIINEKEYTNVTTELLEKILKEQFLYLDLPLNTAKDDGDFSLQNLDNKFNELLKAK